MSEPQKIDRIVRVEPAVASIRPAVNRSTSLTYESFYGLREKPFALSSDPRFFYQSQPHAAAFEDLLAGVRRRESLSVLSGDIGTGKTTLCRSVLQSLDRQTFSAFVWDPFASREELLKMLLMEFGVVSIDDLTSGRLHGASRTELTYLLYEFLRKLASLQASAVVVIDEAHNLSPPVLEEIRILADSDGRERQLQFILVGPPELRDKLALPELRPIEQRISVRCRLEPLTLEGTAGYVAHRLQVAEGAPDRVSFSPDAIHALHESARGVPRLINRVCDRALHHGHLIRAATIDSAIVQRALADVELPEPAPAPVRATAPPSPPASAPEEALPGSVDAWLASLPHSDQPAPTAPEPFTYAQTPFDESLRVPRTHVQRMTRRFVRLMLVAALAAGGLMAGALGSMALLSAWEGHAEEAVVLPALPRQPQPLQARGMTPPEPPQVELVPFVEYAGAAPRPGAR